MASGAPGPPGAASWPRSSGSSTTSRASGTGSRSRRTVCWPWWRRRSAPTRGAATPPRCRCAATGRTSRTGAPPPTRRPRTSSTPTSTSGCSVRRRTRTIWPGSGRTSSSGSKVARTRCRGRPTPTPTRSSTTPPSPAGSRRRRSGPARSSGWWPTSAPTPCWPAPGVANLAAWVAVGRARAAGRNVMLTAELGLWGYQPTPADPYIFNQRVFPATPYLSDASSVLGMVIGGPGTTTVGCLGAAEVDRHGSLNSTQLAGGRFLVGSGGANDVASRATACVVVTLARPERLPETVAYVTSPGQRVVSVVTDKGILRRARRRAAPGRGARRGGHARREGAGVRVVVRVRARRGPPGRGAPGRAFRRGAGLARVRPTEAVSELTQHE